MLDWIQQWYLSQCDGEWEHEYGLKIETIDNPGWSVTIGLKYTELEDVRIRISTVGGSENDWYVINVVDAVFAGSCSPNKLEYVLEEFKALFELGETAYINTRPQAVVIPFTEGYSLSKGLPKSIRQELYDAIDRQDISSLNMHEKGNYLASAIKPSLENLTATSVTDMQALTRLVYYYGWEHIRSKE